MKRLRPALCGPHQRGERPAGTTPPVAPGAGQNIESIDKMHGNAEHVEPASGAAERLPHERDEDHEAQRSEPRSSAKQAARDIESGQLDTDLHDTPGVERVVRDRHAANRDDGDRQVANRSADDLAHKRGQSGRPSHGRDEDKG
ncbi:hypothetical protein GJQ57_01410 [Ralstonia pickettii]|uniref:Uncharacterized protein n=1 Tax=Ralstonia pickettii TaxID=329 RepID=A0A7X2HIU1_RALPI|nr:hypothetical protein [Ralstonia pickettii]MRS97303.1 hypothetical protein [Ralstonia pickettii]OCS45019.1 hypothetical protein BEK67_23075 [Ralstonia pickettii]